MVERLARKYAEYNWANTLLRDRLRAMKAGDPARAEVMSEIKAGNATFQADLRSALGEANYVQYQQFSRTFMLQTVPGDLAATLASAGEPLSASQGDALADSLVRHATDANGKIDPRKVDWNGVIAEASGMLTPEQTQNLRLIAASRQTAAEVNRLQAARR